MHRLYVAERITQMAFIPFPAWEPLSGKFSSLVFFLHNQSYNKVLRMMLSTEENGVISTSDDSMRHPARWCFKNTKHFSSALQNTSSAMHHHFASKQKGTGCLDKGGQANGSKCDHHASGRRRFQTRTIDRR
jgi:hypothetical protein